MSDSRQNPPPSPGSNNTIIFIVGALVVAVGVLGYMFVSGPAPSGDDSAPAVTIENNTTTTAPAADPAPAEPAPAEPAPAEPAPEPAAPAPAAPAANP